MSACSMGFYQPMIKFRSGNTGVLISIEGPDEIIFYDNEKSQTEFYTLKVENKGATDLNDEDIFIRINLKTDFLSFGEKQNSDFLNTKNQKSIELNSISDFSESEGLNIIEGKSRLNPEGDYLMHDFMINFFPPPGDAATSKITADLCYRYKTILNENICINTRKQKEGKGCKTNFYSFYAGQGAPIVVSSLEIVETINEDRTITPKFIFTIDNVNGNIVSLPDGDSFKDGCLSMQNINKIKINSAKLGIYSLVCETEQGNIISLGENQKKVVCNINDKINDNIDGYFSTLIELELEYGYKETTEKEISIIREDTNN